MYSYADNRKFPEPQQISAIRYVFHFEKSSYLYNGSNVCPTIISVIFFGVLTTPCESIISAFFSATTFISLESQKFS